MRFTLMQKVLETAARVYEDMTDQMTNPEIGREFWKYLKSRLLGGESRKIKVSDWVYDYVLRMDAADFERRYGPGLVNIKKSKDQMLFMVMSVTTMLQFSPAAESILEWS